MNTRQQLLHMIEQLSDEQVAVLLPLIASMCDRQNQVFSDEGSQAYQDWVSSKNDLYDELFADDLAAR